MKIKSEAIKDYHNQVANLISSAKEELKNRQIQKESKLEKLYKLTYVPPGDYKPPVESKRKLRKRKGKKK